MTGSICGAGAGLPPKPVTTSGVVDTGVDPQLGTELTVVEGVPPNPPPPKLLALFPPSGALPNPVVGAGEPKPPGVVPNPVAGAPNAVAPLGDVLNPPFDNPPLLGVGLGGRSHPEFAAFKAAACASLSPFDNMIPDNVPVKNVAIGIISSKNFWSIGLIALSGCVTNIKEYSTTNTIPVNVNARQIPIKNFNRAINCSSVYRTG